jgi:hypothetical protein
LALKVKRGEQLLLSRFCFNDEVSGVTQEINPNPKLCRSHLKKKWAL